MTRIGHQKLDSVTVKSTRMSMDVILVQTTAPVVFLTTVEHGVLQRTVSH